MKNSSEIPSVAPYSKEKFEAWRQRHRGDPFSGQWNAILAQRMCDPEVSDADRYLAWLTLYAAGNFSDWPVDAAGNEKFRRDCEQDTGMDRRRVSEAVSANVLLGYVIVPDHKGRFPDGTVGPPGRMIQADGTEEANIKRNPADMSGQDSPSVRFLAFTEEWLSKHPDKQHTREQAERERLERVAIIKAIDYEILTDWKKQREEESASGEEEAKEAAEDLSGQVGQNVRTGRTKRPDRSDKTGSILIDVLTTNTDKRGRQAGSEAVVEEPAASQPASPSPSKKNGHQKLKAPDDLVVALVNRGFPHADFDAIREILEGGSVTNEFYFVKIVDPRLERARRNHESIGPGLLIELAKDAVKANGNVAATRAAGY